MGRSQIIGFCNSCGAAIRESKVDYILNGKAADKQIVIGRYKDPFGETQTWRIYLCDDCRQNEDIVRIILKRNNDLLYEVNKRWSRQLGS